MRFASCSADPRRFAALVDAGGGRAELLDTAQRPDEVPDEICDPHALHIALELNGEVMQSANTGQMIFDVPAIIAAVSEFAPLAPGDVVLTRTPSGVGFRREPKVLLRDGDRVRSRSSGSAAWRRRGGRGIGAHAPSPAHHDRRQLPAARLAHRPGAPAEQPAARADEASDECHPRDGM